MQHEPDAPLAWLGEWWAALGLELDVVRGDLGEPVAERWADVAGAPDGLVVLGGAMGANDDALAPWLAPTRALLADAVALDVPTLGVCLGHQLAAVALGGTVDRNPSGRTVGPVPVRLTGAAASDELLSGFDGLPAIHYNDDVVLEVPSGATVLATLPDGPTAGPAVRSLGLGGAVPPRDLPGGVRRVAALGLPRRPDAGAGDPARRGDRGTGGAAHGLAAVRRALRVARAGGRRGAACVPHHVLSPAL